MKFTLQSMYLEHNDFLIRQKIEHQANHIVT